MDIATSITAPSEAIRMPLTNRPLMRMPRSEARRISSSASVRLNPLSGEISPQSAANSPAAATPPMQPSVAQSVFLLRPVSRMREAAVVSATMPIAVRIGSAPRRSIGIRMNQTLASVYARPSSAISPFRRPITTSSSANTAISPSSTGVRL